ncbi:methyltransferase domain-containing protein [Nonomuraea angiospora]|uniref:class I SAM-dependent methyltransferase n=1 Tax=Nonomuraea angiospora TaxID=46172 RepID=UPI0033226E7E
MTTTVRTTVRRPVFGRMYPKMAATMDEGGMAERRQSLLSGLTGEVVEVGAPVAVEVVPGLAEHLPLADRSVDAVAFCMVLCSLPDVGAALAEARRMLRPG